MAGRRSTAPPASPCAGRDGTGHAGAGLPAGPVAERCPPPAVRRLWRAGLGTVRGAGRTYVAVPAPGWQHRGTHRADPVVAAVAVSALAAGPLGRRRGRAGTGLDAAVVHAAVAADGSAVAVALEHAALAVG
ncbi:hypothetical protein G6F32_013096 [Rhizopus arrhizus]|nr:hypothetical protein G6F32_013096 [Rhizopus arrhizus]